MSANSEAKTEVVDYKALLEKGRRDLVQAFLEDVKFKQHVAAGRPEVRVPLSTFEKYFKGTNLSVEGVSAYMQPLGVSCRVVHYSEDDPEVILRVI